MPPKSGHYLVAATGETGSSPSDQVPFTVGKNNDDRTDHITTGSSDSYDKLFNGTAHVGFSFTVNVPLEYQNASGSWVEFMSGTANSHDRIFNASGGCSLKATGSNFKQSAYRGPWSD
jgi:hypothetical protein